MTIAAARQTSRTGPEPRDRDRVRVGQSAHRRMRDRDAEQDVGDEVDAVERAAADVRASSRFWSGVDLVGDEQGERG